MLDSEGSCRIMGMNYSTQGLNDTSHLNTARLTGFMRNYEHELLNSRTFMDRIRNEEQMREGPDVPNAAVAHCASPLRLVWGALQAHGASPSGATGLHCPSHVPDESDQIFYNFFGPTSSKLK
ncbi:hypothetical protein MTR67_031276 [Solanum verrucosum]|uniref:Uncharacterized protein n=1 Tax=Solanum verrucosum TaxID=315347 RepID=A0AAF0ZDH0_SOLVR|nr:hypothetical protein MTR67_031276 [Solanum verrucosum]